MATATHVADNFSTNESSVTAAAAAQFVATKWDPVAAAAACKAACKEAVGCRAWSAGASALALELGQRVGTQAHGVNNSTDSLKVYTPTVNRVLYDNSNFSTRRTEHIPHPSRTNFGLRLVYRAGLGLGLVFIFV